MKNKIRTLLLGILGISAGTACSQKNYSDANVEEFAAIIGNDSVQLVDVRTETEYKEGHLSGAVNIDMKADDFLQKAKAQLDNERKVAVYCRSGRRSAIAAQRLAGEGFNVVNLLGGIQAWQKEGRDVTTNDVSCDVFKTKSGKELRIFPLIHASIRIQYDGREFEIDPVGKLGQRTTDYAALPKADFIVITHEHGDHFDQKAIDALTSDNTAIILNKRCADMLGKGEAMVNGDKKQLAADVSIEAVPAYNFTEGHTQFHPKGRDNGYILTIDGLRIYIAGDTEDIEEMANISNIDVAFMPCNQPYTMTTQQLLHAAKMVKPKVLYPYHYSQTDVSQLPQQLKSDGIDVRLRPFE